MYIRFAVYLDDLDLNNLKNWLRQTDRDPSISLLFRKWMRAYLEKNNIAKPSTEELTNAPDDDDARYPITAGVPIIPKIEGLKFATALTKPSLPYMGNCAICKFYKELELVTYLDTDQIRQEGELCKDCIRKAKISGSLVG